MEALCQPWRETIPQRNTSTGYREETLKIRDNRDVVCYLLEEIGVSGFFLKLILLPFSMARQTEFGYENNHLRGTPRGLGLEGLVRYLTPLFNSTIYQTGDF